MTREHAEFMRAAATRILADMRREAEERAVQSLSEARWDDDGGAR